MENARGSLHKPLNASDRKWCLSLPLAAYWPGQVMWPLPCGHRKKEVGSFHVPERGESWRQACPVKSLLSWIAVSSQICDLRQPLSSERGLSGEAWEGVSFCSLWARKSGFQGQKKLNKRQAGAWEGGLSLGEFPSCSVVHCVDPEWVTLATEPLSSPPGWAQVAWEGGLAALMPHGSRTDRALWPQAHLPTLGHGGFPPQGPRQEKQLRKAAGWEMTSDPHPGRLSQHWWRWWGPLHSWLWASR